MALAVEGFEHLTLDDLLEAINPPPPSVEERLRRALVVTIKGWEEGQLTDEQAAALITAIVNANANRQMNEMISDFLTPRRRRTGHRRFF